MSRINFNIRHVVTSALIVIFMISAIANIRKYCQKNTVVVESLRSASEVTLPSVTMCPRYIEDFILDKNSCSKNLTECYDDLLKMAQIEKDIKAIWQS